MLQCRLKDFEVVLTTIFVGKNPDSLIECGTHLEGDFPPVLLEIHSCYDPIESLYYSCGYKDICVYCSTEDKDHGGWEYSLYSDDRDDRRIF